MNAQVPLALLGFSAFEQSTIEAFIRTAEARRLRQAGQQEARFVFTSDVEDALIVLVDAGSDVAMRNSRVDATRCIYIGAQGRPDQLAHLARPINLASLLKTLETAADRQLERATSATESSRSGPKIVAPLGARETAASLKSATKRILVADHNDVALRFMTNCLGHFGFEVERARSGEEALSKVAGESYAYVFMDVNMPGIDSYQACKLIKKRPYPAGRSAPVVVMLTSRAGVMDKVRGTLSYCDAHLTKPLQLEALIRILGDRIASDFGEEDATEPVARTI
jgi:CheY-like chemotaxis protein